MSTDERHYLARLEIGRVADELTDAQLRPRQILQDRQLPPRPPGRLAHAARGLGVILPGAGARSSAA
jgi:hypothetical protein